MLRRANLETLPLLETFAANGDQSTRRTFLLTTLFASLPLALTTTPAKAGEINPSETAVTLQVKYAPRIRRRCASPSMTKWSRDSRRIDPINSVG